MNQNEKLWQEFSEQYNLTEKQAEQFKQYHALLVEWNQKINLTAMTDLELALPYHFEDSIKLRDCFDVSSCSMIADIGTGGGLPGIPLKICYPDVKVLLIEVVQKKIDFLNHVIQELGLEGIEVSSLDWRTFVRSTNHSIDLFCARASLRPDELVRALKSNDSPYKNSQIVYWAAQDWQCEPKAQKFYSHDCAYSVGDKKRKYVIFKR